MLKRETEKAKTELNSCQLKISESQLVRADVEPVFGKISKTWQDGLREELDEIKERLAKLEHKF